VDDARDLPSERLLLLFGAPFADVALYYGHNSSPLPDRSLFDDTKFITSTCTGHHELLPQGNFVIFCGSSVRVVRRIRVADHYDGQDSGLL
jgi:hypothetical protein